MGGKETGGWNFYKQLYRVEASSAVTCWPQNKIFIKNIFFWETRRGFFSYLQKFWNST